MKTVSTIALGVALAFAAAMPAAAKDKPAKPAAANFSPDVRAAAGEAQAAIAKGDLATATAKVQAAEAAIKTDDDKLIVGQFYIQIGQKKNDMAMTAKGIDLAIASNKAPADSVPALYASQGTLAFQANDYRKAQAAMEQALKLNSTDPNVVPVLAESQRRNGDLVGALQTLNSAIQRLTAANQPVPKEWYGRGFAIAYEAKPANPNFAAIRQGGIDLGKKWVVAEPTGAVWHDVLLLYNESHTNDVELKRDVDRLLFASGGLKSGNDYVEYAEDVYAKNPGEAKAALDDGVRRGVLNIASNKNAAEINALVVKKIPADKASLAASDKSARTAANGRGALNTADAYAGYGDYAKAIDLYKVALAKGGVDANLVNTRIGIAQFRSGDKAAAKATFAGVTGPRKDLADYWTVLADHPAAG